MGKVYLRKGKMLDGSEECIGRGEKCEKQPCKQRGGRRDWRRLPGVMSNAAASGGSRARASGYLLKEAAVDREAVLEQVYAEVLQCVEGTHAGAVCGELDPPGGRAHAGVGEKCGEEGVTERNCNRLTPASVPHPPVLFMRRRGRGVGNEGVKWSLGKGKGEGMVLISLCFLLGNSILISNK